MLEFSIFLSLFVAALVIRLDRMSELFLCVYFLNCIFYVLQDLSFLGVLRSQDVKFLWCSIEIKALG